MLLARSGKCDAIDATVVCLAADGDDLLTSDPGDLRALAEADEIHSSSSPCRPATVAHARRADACNWRVRHADTRYLSVCLSACRLVTGAGGGIDGYVVE